MKSVTYVAVADDDAIKAAVASIDEDVVYTLTDLDGVIGALVMNPPRTLTVKTTANAGSYVVDSTIIATGVTGSGRAVTETFTITDVDGGETFVGTVDFSRVDSVAIEAQSDVDGEFKIGVRDIVCNGVREIRIGGAGAIKLGYGAATDTVASLVVGERIYTQPTRIYGDASTTATKITLFF